MSGGGRRVCWPGTLCQRTAQSKVRLGGFGYVFDVFWGVKSVFWCVLGCKVCLGCVLRCKVCLGCVLRCKVCFLGCFGCVWGVF